MRETVPEELRERSQWVARRGKVLVNPKTGANARTNDPATWGTFEQAVARSEKDGLDGVGFVFAASDPYAFVDLDKCFDPETAEVDPWAAEVIGRLDSYTEFSSSGEGMHVVVRGEKPGPRCRATVDGHKVEMYGAGQYMALTGRPVPGRPLTVEDRQEELAALYQDTFGETSGDGTGGTLTEPVSPPMRDDEILERCRRARNAEKFAALYDDGDLDGHGGDHSAADQALVSILAFYSQDADQLDRLFRRSALTRPKWERPDYRERTMRFALSAERDYYGAEREHPTVNMIDDIGDAGESAGVPRGVPDVPPTAVPTVPDTVGARRTPPPVPPFPVGALPPDLARFVREAAAEIVCRPEFVANPMLS